MLIPERRCPFCGKLLKKPYWAHIAKEHPEEYSTSRESWVQLFKDYSAAGMASDVSITVISELFNADQGDIKKLLKREGLI